MVKLMTHIPNAKVECVDLYLHASIHLHVMMLNEAKGELSFTVSAGHDYF